MNKEWKEEGHFVCTRRSYVGRTCGVWNNKL